MLLYISQSMNLCAKMSLCIILLILFQTTPAISSFHLCQNSSGRSSDEISLMMKFVIDIDSKSNDCFEFDMNIGHRRNFFERITKMLSLVAITTSIPSKTKANELNDWRNEPFKINNDILSSLVYERVLGKGSYKTVYMVTTKDNQNGMNSVYALAVEELRGKRDVKDAYRGIEISKKLQTVMEETNDNIDQFERVEDWWIQSKGLPVFEKGHAVFPLLENLKERTKKEPRKFLGSKWMIALKPFYDMDLKRFAQKTPLAFFINDTDQYPSRGVSSPLNPATLAGISLGSGSALKLTLELCHEGKLMHSAGIVHRDIKPKNIMIWKGRPLIIDFGFSKTVEKSNGNDRVCITQQVGVKGEVGYLLAKDVEMSRGCQEGDRYAMGKTLYELFFGQCEDFDSVGKVGITLSDVQLRNSEFRTILAAQDAASKSRFLMSQAVRDIIMCVIIGLCSEGNAITFSDAETLILSFLAKREGLVDS